MLLVLLVAAYLAGMIASNPRRWLTSPEGKWQAHLPAGFKRPVTLQRLENDRYLFASGGSVFNGVYRWKDGKLTVVEPDDTRMVGLIWNWDGERFTLVAEPKDEPTGQSYLGTRLTPVAN
jgi:hypothetical protein